MVSDFKKKLNKISVVKPVYLHQFVYFDSCLAPWKKVSNKISIIKPVHLYQCTRSVSCSERWKYPKTNSIKIYFCRETGLFQNRFFCSNFRNQIRVEYFEKRQRANSEKKIWQSFSDETGSFAFISIVRRKEKTTIFPLLIDVEGWFLDMWCNFEFFID